MCLILPIDLRLNWSYYKSVCYLVENTDNWHSFPCWEYTVVEND